MHPARLALVVASLLVAPACEGGACGQDGGPTPLDLGVGADLYAVATPGPDRPADAFFAVGADGTIVASTGGVATVDHPVTTELRAVAVVDGDVIAVGDRGTVVRRRDGESAWQVVDVATTVNLHAVGSDGASAVIAGDDLVLVHDRDTDTWSEAPRPGEGWGALRVVVDNRAGVHVFGLAGAGWTAQNPRDPWMKRDLQTTADLLAGAGEVVVGTGGTVLRLSLQDAWNPLPLGVDERPDFVAAAPSAALSADGRVFELSDDGVAEQAALGDGFTALAAGAGSLLAVGLGGRAVALDASSCGLASRRAALRGDLLAVLTAPRP